MPNSIYQSDDKLQALLIRISKGATFSEIFSEYIKFEESDRLIIERAFPQDTLADETYTLCNELSKLLMRSGKESFLGKAFTMLSSMGVNPENLKRFKK